MAVPGILGSAGGNSFLVPATWSLNALITKSADRINMGYCFAMSLAVSKYDKRLSSIASFRMANAPRLWWNSG